MSFYADRERERRYPDFPSSTRFQPRSVDSDAYFTPSELRRSQTITLPSAEEVGNPGSISVNDYVTKLGQALDSLPYNFKSGNRDALFQFGPINYDERDGRLILVFPEISSYDSEDFMYECRNGATPENTANLLDTTGVSKITIVLTPLGDSLHIMAIRNEGLRTSSQQVHPTVFDKILEGIRNPNDSRQPMIQVGQTEQEIETTTQPVHYNPTPTIVNNSGTKTYMAQDGNRVVPVVRYDVPLTPSRPKQDVVQRAVPYGQRHPENRGNGKGSSHKRKEQKHKQHAQKKNGKK